MKNKINPQLHHSQGTVLLVRMKEIWSQNLNLISLRICKTQMSWSYLRVFFQVIPLKIISLLLIYLKFPGTRISMNLYVAYSWQMLEEQPTVRLFSLLSPTLIFLRAISAALSLRSLHLRRSVSIWELRAQIPAVQALGANFTHKSSMWLMVVGRHLHNSAVFWADKCSQPSCKTQEGCRSGNHTVNVLEV